MSHPKTLLSYSCHVFESEIIYFSPPENVFELNISIKGVLQAYLGLFFLGYIT
jgi:hypothetical protein